MKIRVITLAYSDALNGFPEDALTQATFGQEVLEVRDHFFVHGGKPHLVLVLMLGETQTSGGRRSQARGEDPAKSLPEHLLPLYRDLRNWRNEKARSEGIPSYLIFRNAQLAEICRGLPRTLAALKEIEGIGEATCKKYGREVLGLVPGDLEPLNVKVEEGMPSS